MTEMWERFSYYGMRALLPLYLVAPGGLHMNAGTASAIYAVYLSLVYLLALPGGWVADRFLGPPARRWPRRASSSCSAICAWPCPPPRRSSSVSAWSP
ncbi:hypothetical protein GCM10020256_46660 [Streptomyces thermocoprophilus]